MAYHLRHASEWVIRLGDGTEESHARAAAALDELWTYTGELFEMDAGERDLVRQGIAVDRETIRPIWQATLDRVLAEATLAAPRRPLDADAAAARAGTASTSATCSPRCRCSTAPIPAQPGERLWPRSANSTSRRPLPARGRGATLEQGGDAPRRLRPRARALGSRGRRRSRDPRPDARGPRRPARRRTPRRRDRRQAHPDLHRLPGHARNPAGRRGGARRGRARRRRASRPCSPRPGPPTTSPRTAGASSVTTASPRRPAVLRPGRCSPRRPWPARSAARPTPPASPSSARPPARPCGAARPARSPSTTSSVSEPMPDRRAQCTTTSR